MQAKAITLFVGFLLILVSCGADNDVEKVTVHPSVTVGTVEMGETAVVSTDPPPTPELRVTIATHTAVPTPTPPPIATETAVPPSPSTVQSTQVEDVIIRLETLQTNYEHLLDNHEGWLYARYTEYIPTALRGTAGVNFYGLADNWVTESWYEVDEDAVMQQIIHVSDESGGIWQRQLIADGWSAFVLPVETLEGRVKHFDSDSDSPTINTNTLWGPYWLIQQLQQTAVFDITGWEADDLYHVTLYGAYETPVEVVGFEASATAGRSHYVFENERGVMLQRSFEVLLTTGEWRQMNETTFIQFDLLDQLPDNAAYTLQEGTALLAADH